MTRTVTLMAIIPANTDTKAGLPKVGPAGQSLPTIRFDLACQMFPEKK